MFDSVILCNYTIAAYHPKCCSAPHLQIFPTSPMWPRPPPWPPQWCWPSRSKEPCTRLPPKHWSDHMPQWDHLALLHQLADWYRHRWEKTKPAQWSRDSSLFWHISGGTNPWPLSGQQSHSPSSTKDSRLICPDFTSTLHSMTPSHISFCSIDGFMSWFLSCDKCTHCKSLWTIASAKCPKCKCTCQRILGSGLNGIWITATIQTAARKKTPQKKCHLQFIDKEPPEPPLYV